MVTAILIDDEKPALRELKFLLDAYPELSVLGMYNKPLEAIEMVGRQKPDVVFLDINMPKLMGTDAASRILDASPDTDIVFVTAYDKYAVEAFEIHALDYILKPVEAGRFEKTIQRIFDKKSRQSANQKGQKNQRLCIKSFGKLQVGWEGQEPMKWRTEKTRELFAYLLCNSGWDITKEEIADRLWPEEEPDRAMKQLYNGIYYIRKSLEAYGIGRALISINSSYHMKIGEINWDYGRFNELYRNLGNLGPAGLAEMEALYTGELLEGEPCTWIELEREKSMKKYEQCIKRLSDLFLEEKQTDKIEELLLTAFNKVPLNENFSELLLKLYRRTGNRFDAVKHYNTYARLLKQELDAEPDRKLKELLG
jgi:two-component SAPR family response regulator